jgi:hypothetical protein
MKQLFDIDGDPLYLYEIRFAQTKGDWMIGTDSKKAYAYGKHFGTVGRHGASRLLLIDTHPAAATVHARRVLANKFEKWQAATKTIEEPREVKSAVLLSGGMRG